MPGSVRVSTAGRNAMLNALRPLLHGGTVELFTAPQPATPDTPIGAQLALGTLALADPVAPEAGSGALALAEITEDAFADAAGDIAWGRLWSSSGVAVLDLSVGVVGSGSVLELASTTVEAGQRIVVESASLAIPS